MSLVLDDGQVTETVLSPSIGVELQGLRMDTDTDPSTAAIDLLWDALARHHVVVLRDQDLSPEAHLRLATALGEPTVHPVQQLVGSDRALSTIEDTPERPPAGFPWHTDLTWAGRPPGLGLLYSVVIPPWGGDTLWRSTVHLHQSLDEDQQTLAERMRLVHAPDESLLASVERHHGGAVRDQLIADHPPISRPLVFDHPLSGQLALYLSPMYTTRLVDDDPAQQRLLDLIHERLDGHEHLFRHRWREGDLVIWDESVTCHRALTDHYPQHRIVRRCSTQWPENLQPILW